MDFNKRYCQNRVRKRKKTLQNTSPERKISSVEDERQFKLNRFVKDVTKFIEEKDGCTSDQEEPLNNIGSPVKKTVKRMKPAHLVARRGLFQNGIQTKFYSRGGVFGREVTARLDEDLQQIISLANTGENPNCKQTYAQSPRSKPRTRAKVVEQTKPACQPLPQQLHSRTSPHCSSDQPPSTIECVRLECRETLTDRDKSPSMLDKLDAKLYPEFTRIITLSSIETKSVQFRNKSYVNALKKELLEIHKQRRKENSEELSCPSDVQKSNVATSPLRSPSPLTEPQAGSSNPQTQHTSDSEQGFTCINFVPEPLKSTAQFLEETIGPGSSCKSAMPSPAHQTFSKETPHSTYRLLESFRREFSPRKPDHCEPLPRQQEYYEPLSRQPDYYEPLQGHTSVAPSCNLMMPFDGGGDRLFSSSLNLFLPPHEEESPEFQYFPRRMF